MYLTEFHFKFKTHICINGWIVQGHFYQSPWVKYKVEKYFEEEFIAVVSWKVLEAPKVLFHTPEIIIKQQNVCETCVKRIMQEFNVVKLLKTDYNEKRICKNLEWLIHVTHHAKWMGGKHLYVLPT